MCNSMEKLRGLIAIQVVILMVFSSLLSGLDLPTFKNPIENVTVAIGREAILTCAVENLYPYKVAWLKVDTQTILTIHNHVITKNNRIAILHPQNNVWKLHIKDVRESDHGWYMCQINTDPMKSQTGYLEVVVPPDILDYPTSTDMVVDEGTNVTLQCIAKGRPQPKVIWKREDGGKMDLENNTQATTANGQVLKITNIKRHQMGAYLCIASNGIPPTVSKRIKLIVQFAPNIWIKYQLIGAYDGQTVTLECHSQAYPKSINYWVRDTGEIIPHGVKYTPKIIEDGYNVYMKLRINNLKMNDYGVYKCVSKNAIADMEGSINIYRIPDPNKLLGKRKHGHSNASIVGAPRISDDIITKENNLNISYRRIATEKDHLNLPGFYSSGRENHYSSALLLYIVSILLSCVSFVIRCNIRF